MCPLMDQLNDLSLLKSEFGDHLTEISKKCDNGFTDINTRISDLRNEIIKKIDDMVPEITGNAQIKEEEKEENKNNYLEMAKQFYILFNKSEKLPPMNVEVMSCINNMTDFVEFVVNVCKCLNTEVIKSSSENLTKAQLDGDLREQKIRILESQVTLYKKQLEEEKATVNDLTNINKILSNDLNAFQIKNDELLNKIENLHHENNSCPFCQYPFKNYEEVVNHVKSCKRNTS